MKTPDEVLQSADIRIFGPSRRRITEAMKEYAKQWIDRASEVALIEEEKRFMDGVISNVECHRFYKFNSAKYKYSLTVDEQSITELKKQIDAQ